MAERLPSVLSPSEGELFNAGPFRIVTRVAGIQTQNAFEMYELALGPATIDYHVHLLMDETIHILQGEIEFCVVGQKYRRLAGSTAFVPRGHHHGFTNHGPGEARVLIVFSPSSTQSEYFRALEKLLAAPTLDAVALKALQKKYDQELVPADS